MDIAKTKSSVNPNGKEEIRRQMKGAANFSLAVVGEGSVELDDIWTVMNTPLREAESSPVFCIQPWTHPLEWQKDVCRLLLIHRLCHLNRSFEENTWEMTLSHSLANYGLWTQLDQPSAFVNKLWLEPGHSHLFSYGCFHNATAKLNSGIIHHLAHQPSNI